MGLFDFEYDETGASFKIFRGNFAIDSDAMMAVREITIEASAFLPRVCEIEFLANPGYLDAGGLQVNDEISVYTYAMGSVKGSVVFKGQIRSIEVRLDSGNGARMVVRAYDKASDMLSMSRTKGYKESTYSEVVKEIAGKYNLDSFLGSAIYRTNVKYDLVVQSNESDWDFICRLAREVGFVVFVKVYTVMSFAQVKLYFGPPAQASKVGKSRDVRFAIGDSRTISVKASMSGGGVPTSAKAPGWDMKKTQGAVGSQSLGSTQFGTIDSRTGGSRYRSAKAGTKMLFDQMGQSRAESDQLAKAYARRMAAAAVDIELVVRGNPSAKINEGIEIEDAGPLEGRYTISGVTHVFSNDGSGFTSTIYCSGLEDRTIAGIQGEVASQPLLAGVYPGVVNTIDDPLKKGRVTLTLPWLDSTYVTDWAPVVQMGAGAGKGWQFIPAPKDEVLVGFQHGKLDAPYVIGSVYGKNAGRVKASDLYKDGKPIKQVFSSKLGHQIIIDDSTDKSGITIRTKNGQVCTIELSGTEGIKITTKGEKGTVNITSSADVTITTPKNAKVSAQDVSLTAKGKVNVKGTSDVKVSGSNVTVQATSKATIKGASVNVEAAGKLTLKGGVVNIN